MMPSRTITLTGSSASILGQPKKDPGWCERENVEHSWESGPILTSNPPMPTRVCVNCGKRQHQRPPAWVDD